MNCWYIYDEALWDHVDNIEPWTNIDTLINENIHCPVCSASFDDFSPIEDEILYAEDPQNLNHLEMEHIPHIVYQDDSRIEVSVGKELHTMDDDHRITAMYLVDDEGHIVEEVFIMPDEEPIYEFDISDLDIFELRSSCSKHWLWSSWLIEAI